LARALVRDFGLLFLAAVLAAAARAQPPRPPAVASCPGLDRLLSFQGENDKSLLKTAREAEARAKQGDAETALRLYQQAAAASPQDWFALLRMGEFYRLLGRDQEAISVLNKSNAILETSFAYESMGAAYFRESDYGRATQSYQKALLLCPESADLYSRAAVAFYQMGNYDEAIRAIETGLQKPPLQLVANPAPGSLEQQDQWNKAALNDTLTDVYVARGMYAEASKRLGEKKIIGIEAAEAQEGIRVARVLKGYPAQLAGLAPGDILVTFNGEALAGVKVADFAGRIVQAPAFGAEVKATVDRGGKQYDAMIIVGVTPDLAAAAARAAHPAVSGAGTAPPPSTPGTKPTVASPSVKIERLKVRPDHISAGAPFEVDVDFVVEDPAAGSGSVPMECGYRIQDGQKVLFAPAAAKLEEPNGATRRRTLKLTASRTKGKYSLQVFLHYGGLAAEKSVDFQIE
jgi:tetratricopeptide (TPR) repeat protein